MCCTKTGTLLIFPVDFPLGVRKDHIEHFMLIEYDLAKHRLVGIDPFDDVILNAHKQGWMQGGEWAAQAA